MSDLNSPSARDAKIKPMRDMSYSSNKELKTCSRKYQIRKLFTQPKHAWETGLAAAGGTAIHEYLQTRIATNSIEQARMAFFYGFDFVAEEEATPFTRDNRGFEACLHTAEALYAEMDIDQSQLAYFEINGESRPAIELRFQIVFTSEDWACDYRFRGAIDLVTYSDFFKRYKAIDFKTHRDYKQRSSENQEHKFKYDSQLVPYGLILEHLTGNSTDGKYLKFDTEYHSLFVDILDPDHRAYNFKRDISDVHAWFESVTSLIADMERFNDREVWPRTNSGCEFWGRPCAFFKNCHISDHEELQNRLLNYGEWEVAEERDFNPWVTLYMEV